MDTCNVKWFRGASILLKTWRHYQDLSLLLQRMVGDYARITIASYAESQFLTEFCERWPRTIRNFEVVTCVGSVRNVSNDIEKEIKMRITQRNRCFYALDHLFRSAIVSFATQLRINRINRILRGWDSQIMSVEWVMIKLQRKHPRAILSDVGREEDLKKDGRRRAEITVIIASCLAVMEKVHQFQEWQTKLFLPARTLKRP